MGPGFESPEVHQSAVPTPNSRAWIANLVIAYPEGEGSKEAVLERVVSVFNAVGPPVSIPNTEVKRCSGENTWLATAREDNSMLTQKEYSGSQGLGSRLY